MLEMGNNDKKKIKSRKSKTSSWPLGGAMHVTVSPHSPSGEDVMDVAAGSKPPWKTANAATASRMAGGGGTRPGRRVMTGAGRAAASTQGAVWGDSKGRVSACKAREEGQQLILRSGRVGGGRKTDLIRSWKTHSA